ncbi:MAG: hypothetical protein NW241_15540 [Bacteroidia bacterium]|nr:hypothetical protein [Bacteroidia bacterium]
MSKAFQEALLKARALTPQEQLALVAALSQLLSYEQWTESPRDGMLSEQEEAEVLSRINAYEAGKAITLSGSDFREELRKKYGG